MPTKLKECCLKPYKSVVSSDAPNSALSGAVIGFAEICNYLCICLDGNLRFKHHAEIIAKKPRASCERFQSCFSPSARKHGKLRACFCPGLVMVTSFTGFARSSVSSDPDSLYHAARRYIAKSAYRTHQYILYNLIGWSSLVALVSFLNKALLGHLFSHGCSKLGLSRPQRQCSVLSHGAFCTD